MKVNITFYVSPGCFISGPREWCTETRAVNEIREFFAIFRALLKALYHTRLSKHRNIVGPFSKIRELSSTALTETLKLLTNCYLLQQ